MNKLVEFYKNVLESLGMGVKEDFSVVVPGEVDRPLMIDGLPVYLPDDAALRTATQMMNGKVEKTKFIFNPLAEDSIKGENKSFKKLKDIMELKLLGVIYQIGESLFNIAADKKQDITDMEIVKFISLLNTYKAPGIKQVIDNKTIENWANMYTTIINNGVPNDMKYTRFYIKKGGNINGVKYNRTGVITYPFVENLLGLPAKQTEYLDTKLRKKDIHTYHMFFKYLYGHLESDKNQFGSLNNVAPATHTLLVMYGNVVSKLSEPIASLVNLGVEEDVVSKLQISQLNVQLDTLGDFIDSLKGEIKRVPLETSTPKLQEDTNPLTKPNIVNQQNPQQIIMGNANPVINNNPAAAAPANSNESFWDKFGGNSSFNNNNTVVNNNQNQMQQRPAMVANQQVGGGMVNPNMMNPNMMNPNMVNQNMMNPNMIPVMGRPMGPNPMMGNTYGNPNNVDPWDTGANGYNPYPQQISPMGLPIR